MFFFKFQAMELRDVSSLDVAPPTYFMSLKKKRIVNLPHRVNDIYVYNNILNKGNRDFFFFVGTIVSLSLSQ